VAFVLLPAAMPHLMVGMRLVIAYTLIAAIAGEFILSSAGIGHEIAFAYDNFETAKMYGLILIVVVLAVGLNAALGLGSRGGAGRSGTSRGSTGLDSVGLDSVGQDGGRPAVADAGVTAARHG